MHVSLYVADINKTVGFYNQFFAQEPEKVKADYAKYVLTDPSLIISFVQNEERVRSNFGHLGFQVNTEEELNARMEAIKKTDLAMVEEMGTNCCYAYQDKFWVADPDGHQWEIYHFHEDVEFNDPKYETENSENCCVPPKVKKNLRDLAEECCEPGSGCC